MKEEKQVEPQLSYADVVEPIPRTMRPRATALLYRLKDMFGKTRNLKQFGVCFIEIGQGSQKL